MIYDIFGLIVGAVFTIFLAILLGAVFFDGLRMEREKREIRKEREQERENLILDNARFQTDIYYLYERLSSLESRCDNEK